MTIPALSRHRAAACLLAFATMLPMALPAEAYPTCVVFTPVAVTPSFGAGNASLYQAYFPDGTSNWYGVNIGVVPRWPYGDTGLAFGGLEVGLDIVSEAGLNPDIKPLANFKAQLLEENGWLPHLAVGVMSYAFLHRSRSLNFAYGVATKSVGDDGRFGRFTAGMGEAMPASPDLWSGTAPFAGSQHALLLGYEFPAVGPFTFAIDHCGGDSEVSGSDVVVNLEIAPTSFASIGYAIGADRKALHPDTYFVQLFTNFDTVKIFAPKAKEGT